MAVAKIASEGLLHLDNLSKSYGKKNVLSEISFSMKKGESVALVGANGAGKSTLIKIILGLVQASSGTGQLFSQPFSSPIARSQVGYLPELPSFWSELNARELLDFFARFRKMAPEKNRQRIESLLLALGLSTRAEGKLGTFSKGMLQRSALAQALLHDPPFLILDEPMSGLDPRAQEKLREILKQLKAQGKTLLISTHALDDIRLLCDRVLVLERTKLVRDGSTQEVLEELVEKYRSSEPWDDDPMGDVASVFT